MSDGTRINIFPSRMAQVGGVTSHPFLSRNLRHFLFGTASHSTQKVPPTPTPPPVHTQLVQANPRGCGWDFDFDASYPDGTPAAPCARLDANQPSPRRTDSDESATEICPEGPLTSQEEGRRTAAQIPKDLEGDCRCTVPTASTPLPSIPPFVWLYKSLASSLPYRGLLERASNGWFVGVSRKCPVIVIAKSG
jgi:hypothetical protein